MSARTIFVVSDTHFNHANILKFTGADGRVFRPFASVEEMNETMIERWNARVRDGDLVYHLGDVYMTDPKLASEVLSRLRGRKRLILGNHDVGKDKLLHAHFEKIMLDRSWPDYGLKFSHVPVHPSSLHSHRANKDLVNVHGHIHQNRSPDGPYFNACVERTDWGPLSVEEIVERVR